MLITLYFQALAKFTFASFLFAFFYFFPNIKINEQLPWWRNSVIFTDLLYLFTGPLFYLILRSIPCAMIYFFLIFFVPSNDVYHYLEGGYGPLSKISPMSQGAIFFLLSDFLMYWSHRSFHNKILWPFHMIHHTPKEVDWTTSYRFHPLNLALGTWLIVLSVITLGVSPENILFFLIIENFMACFVHSNLNITLGPLKHIIATPVFHRWHHTYAGEGGEMNYGAMLALWDVIFGTYYFPSGRMPDNYGIMEENLNENFINQITYPFIAYSRKIFKFLTRVNVKL